MYYILLFIVIGLTYSLSFSIYGQKDCYSNDLCLVQCRELGRENGYYQYSLVEDRYICYCYTALKNDFFLEAAENITKVLRSTDGIQGFISENINSENINSENINSENINSENINKDDPPNCWSAVCAKSGSRICCTSGHSANCACNNMGMAYCWCA